MVPGHEVVGIVEAVGPKVAAKFAVGSRVGVGCMVDSCQDCSSCSAGHEQYCEKGFIGTYNGKIHDPNRDYVGNPAEFQPGVNGEEAAPTTWGGYSTKLVVRQEFAITIPDGLSLEQAAPILCAGITMFSPIKHWGLQAGDSLGIMGRCRKRETFLPRFCSRTLVIASPPLEGGATQSISALSVR